MIEQLSAATLTPIVTWLWEQYGKSTFESAVDHGKEWGRWKWSIENYYESLYRRVGFIRILGRSESEPLENIFTHVNVLDKPSAEQRYNIAQLVEKFPPRAFREQEVKRITGTEAVAGHDRLFILGKPGAGKTTFLKQTALRAIEGELEQKVPIFVTLKEMVDDNNWGGSVDDIVAFIVDQFAVHQFPDAGPFVERLLHGGDAIILFDGLDEVNVADNQRGQLITALNNFAYRYLACPILLTCRVAATDYTFNQFKYVEMADFEEKQIVRYIERWFGRNPEKGARCRQELLESGANEPIRELAQIPLLLSLLCLAYEKRNEFPPNRHETYEEATRALLVEWDASRNISRDTIYRALSVRRREQMLAHIANTTFGEGIYFIPERHLATLIETYLAGVPGLADEEVEGRRTLQAIEAQHGLIVERAHTIHSFSHLTLQEYFTALYIVANERQGSVERLMSYVTDDRWEEVFLPVAGMLLDATEFFQLFLDRLDEIIATDSHIVSLLGWIAEKEQNLTHPYRPAAVRAYLWFPVTDFGGEGIVINSLALAGAIDSIIFSSVTLSIILAQYSDNKLLGLKNISNMTIANDNAVTVAEHSGDSAFQSALAELVLPPADTDIETATQYYNSLEEVLSEHQDRWELSRLLPIKRQEIPKGHKLSEEQIQLLGSYLKATRLLLRCLEVAYTPARQSIENRLLLPPR